MSSESLQSRTVSDFAEQWEAFPDNYGYYSSVEYFADIVRPILTPEDVRGKFVADIGSGSGRTARMLLDAGANHVIALEPSRAFELLKQHTDPYHGRITCLNTTGDQLPATGDLDFVFSIGVVHHIPEPRPVIEAAYRALRPGGQIILWLYAREGNGLYLAFAKPLRVIAKRMPHPMLMALSWLLYWPLAGYVLLCKKLRVALPMKSYMADVLGKIDRRQVRLVIYDQLNPAYAKYYWRDDAIALVARAGFQNIRIHHRRAYSWLVAGTKPHPERAREMRTTVT